MQWTSFFVQRSIALKSLYMLTQNYIGGRSLAANSPYRTVGVREMSPSAGMRRDQFVEFSKQRRVVGAWIGRQTFPIVLQVEEEGFDALLIQVVPVGAITHPVEVEGVEYLF